METVSFISDDIEEIKKEQKKQQAIHRRHPHREVPRTQVQGGGGYGLHQERYKKSGTNGKSQHHRAQFPRERTAATQAAEAERRQRQLPVRHHPCRRAQGAYSVP